MQWWLEEDDEWTFEKIIEYVSSYEEVHVGCDSKFYSHGTKFATAIAVYQNPCVTYWYSKERSATTPREIRYRLWTEVEKALVVAWKIRESLPDIRIVVHCDINSDERFPSSTLNASASGYVTGCGFEYRNKPGAWCATGCADYHTR
tara:strand:+ start:864 stop:1304 length:441 start_codon:yes stop_codon:yes gene_type:complete